MVYINLVYIQTILLNLDGFGEIKICLMDIEILICNLDEISVRSCGGTGKLPTIFVPQFDTFVMNASISYIQLKDEFLF